MIFADLSDALLYRGIHPRLDMALALLTEEFLSSVGREPKHLAGEAMYVARFDGPTSADETRPFEYHRRFLDLFVTVKGQERVDLSACAAMAALKQEGDCWLCAGEAQQRVILSPGSFLALFPGEAHRPGMAVHSPQTISRIVFKILYKET